MRALRAAFEDCLAAIVFAALFAVTHNVPLAAAAAVGIALLQISFAFAYKRTIHSLQWAIFGLVLVSGALSMVSSDPRFVMMKPTVAHIILGIAMLKPGWQARYAPPSRKIPERTLIAWGYAWAVLQFLIAVANLVAALTLDPVAWSGVKIALSLSQAVMGVVQFVATRPVKPGTPSKMAAERKLS